MRACDSLSLLLGRSSALFERRELPAQRRDLLVEQLDLRQRARGQASSAASSCARQARSPCRVPACRPSSRPLSRSRSVSAVARLRAQLRERVLEVRLADLFQRQQLGELRELRVEPLQRGVLAGDFLRQEELHDHEHREQEHDAEDQRRQRVDEAGPVVDAAFAARCGQAPCYLTVLRSSSLRGSLARRCASSSRLISRLLLRPARRPSRGSSAARCACGWTRPWIASARLAIAAVAARFEPVSATASCSRRSRCASRRTAPAIAGARRASTVRSLHGGREPVFQFGVEAVLRLARLQIEEAEHQRAGKAEQRGRERNAHAAERRGEAFAQRVEHGAGVAADLEVLDDVADRADGLDQAPERAEQAEEDQQAVM